MEGGRGGLLVQWQIFKIFNTNIDLGTVADIAIFEIFNIWRERGPLVQWKISMERYGYGYGGYSGSTVEDIQY